MKNILIALTLVFGLIGAQTKSQLKNVQVLPFAKKKEIVRYMKTVIAPELGVKCSFCHNLMDYSSDQKDHKIVARAMIKMVKEANKNTMAKLNFSDISCYVCHRGEKYPPTKPKK